MEQELRRFINKHEAMELLQQLQKPFSFDSKNQHTRPQTPANKDPNKKPLFIAKEVPSHVKQVREMSKTNRLVSEISSPSL